MPRHVQDSLPILLLVPLVAVGLACAEERHRGEMERPEPAEGCSDQDGDGWGVGPECAGPDCNDRVAEIHTDEQCAAWCEEHGNAPGCPCDNPEPVICYTGPAGTEGVGACRDGLMNCSDGLWGECAGQVLPVDEICDGLDNDCDGEPDEGVLSECGTCGECNRECVGPNDECVGWGESRTPGIVETPEGWLTLDGVSSTIDVIWPSSSDRGEILRVNTSTYEVEGAYRTGPEGAWESPSRSAVDDFGAVIIANRHDFGPGGRSSITKIAAAERRCIDSNGNGRIDTSGGPDDVLPFESHDHWDDECILWHTVLTGSGARGVTLFREEGLDGSSKLVGWVGLLMDSRFEQFDPETGELTGAEALTPGCSPYAAAVDRDGWIWLTVCPTAVGRFDSTDPGDTFEILPVAAASFPKRVIVDETNTPWFSGREVFKFDRDEETFVGTGLVASQGNLAADGEGSIWVASYKESGPVYRVDTETLEWHSIRTGLADSFGTGVDFHRKAWVFAWQAGNAAVIDLDTEEVEIVLDDCGGPCLGTAYVRGDVSGLQRTNAVSPSALWSTVAEGCADGSTSWSTLEVDALTPGDSRIALFARVARSIEALSDQPWRLLGEVPTDGDVFDLAAALPHSEHPTLLEIQAELVSPTREHAPVLRELAVLFGCNFSIE